MEITSFCEARPAVTPGYETNVEDEENRKEIVCYSDSYRCTDEPPFELLRWSDAEYSDKQHGQK